MRQDAREASAAANNHRAATAAIEAAIHAAADAAAKARKIELDVGAACRALNGAHGSGWLLHCPAGNRCRAMGNSSLGYDRRVLFHDGPRMRSTARLMRGFLMNALNRAWRLMCRARRARPGFAAFDQVTAGLWRGWLMRYHRRRAAIHALTRCAICERWRSE